ncbi:MAG TPA: PGPGW domain-containing protein [Pirellulales bacterium]|nr:PGPGW domain-containing protein [Pirellulales bacterium]
MDDPSPPNNADPRSPVKRLGRLGRWKFGRQLTGWGLLLFGLVGVPLPIIPGWVFIAWGMVILSPDVPFFARLLDRVAHRIPQLRSAIERVRGQTEN